MNTNNKVVIIGCGLMGTEIAAVFLATSWEVLVVEPDTARWEDSRAAMTELLPAMCNQNIKTNLISIDFVATLPEVNWRGVDLVIETAAEDFAIKKTIFESLDQVVPDHIVIGTNSSGYPISEIAKSCASSHRMANTHFFLPASIVPLVEIAKGENTSDVTMNRLQACFERANRVVVKINKDLPGFLANRMQHALMREVFSILDAGLATPEDIDKAVRYGFGFRYVAAGPLLQKELAGLETQLAAATSIYPSLCNDTTPPKGLAQMVEEGKFGAKSLQGYWSWTDARVQQERRRYMDLLMKASKLLSEDVEI